MKKISAIGVSILFLAFTFLITYSLGYFQINLTQAKADNKVAQKAEYHFAVILQNTDDSFWQSVKEGCSEAAKTLHAAVEFNAPRFTNLDEQLKYLNIAIASRVDGIITHVLDGERFTALIDKAYEANIPVITIEDDAKNSKRMAYVGTNTYNLGVESGKLVLQSTGYYANVAVILNNYIVGSENVPQNLRVAGLKDALKDTPSVNILTVQSSSTGFLSAEEVTRKILNQYPGVNTIVCTNAKDTISVAQIIVDLNKVGQINIIGYDDSPEILRYIEKGVIFGTVVANPYEIGYESIRSMVEIKKNRMTSSYVDTGAKVVTKANLDEYKDALTQKLDKDGESQ